MQVKATGSCGHGARYQPGGPMPAAAAPALAGPAVRLRYRQKPLPPHLCQQSG
jgi:hypothetical protein